MNNQLDRDYLDWLYGQINPVRLRNPARTYWSLARQLYTKEFFWLIPNDDNRVEDGRDLRYEFLADRELDEGDVDPVWLGEGCSVLELLIALARRLAYESEKISESAAWFWHLIENMDLVCSDKDYNSKAQKEADETLDRLIWRTYKPNGRGGLFPLDNPKEDQRDVEIWYQLNAYLLENE